MIEEHLIAAAYNLKLEQIKSAVEQMGPLATTTDKLAMVFDHLVNNVVYDYANATPNSVTPNGDLKGYNNYPLQIGEQIVHLHTGRKETALLLGKAVCGGIAKTVLDICNDLSIPCQIIKGRAEIEFFGEMREFGHAFNKIQLEDGREAYLDVTRGIIQNEQQLNPYEYFLVDEKNLANVGLKIQESVLTGVSR